GLESLAHSSECCTVLPAQCRKQTRFCNRPFLIRSTFASRRSNKLQKTPALFTFPAEHYIGNETNSSNDSITVAGAGTLFASLQGIVVGRLGSFHRFTASNSAKVWAGR